MAPAGNDVWSLLDVFIDKYFKIMVPAGNDMWSLLDVFIDCIILEIVFSKKRKVKSNASEQTK